MLTLGKIFDAFLLMNRQNSILILFWGLTTRNGVLMQNWSSTELNLFFRLVSLNRS